MKGERLNTILMTRTMMNMMILVEKRRNFAKVIEYQFSILLPRHKLFCSCDFVYLSDSILFYLLVKPTKQVTDDKKNETDEEEEEDDDDDLGKYDLWGDDEKDNEKDSSSERNKNNTDSRAKNKPRSRSRSRSRDRRRSRYSRSRSRYFLIILYLHYRLLKYNFSSIPL